MKRAHSWMCLALLVAGLVLVRTGASVAGDDSAKILARMRVELLRVDRAIAKLERRIKRARGKPEQAALLHRLAEQLIERARLEYRRAAESDGKLQAYSTAEFTSAGQVAIQTLQRILKDHPKYGARDQVMLLIGAQYRELGQFGDMVAAYERLLDKHPNGSAAGEALMILGNFYYDRSELDLAERYYARVLAQPKASLANSARYRLGWVAINRADCKRAAGLFEKVVVDPAAAKDSTSPGSGLPINLREMALEGLVFCYDRVYRPDRALEYFSAFSLSEEEALQVLPRLANRLYVVEQYRAAHTIYCHLLKLTKNAEERKEWTERARELAAKLKKTP